MPEEYHNYQAPLPAADKPSVHPGDSHLPNRDAQEDKFPRSPPRGQGQDTLMEEDSGVRGAGTRPRSSWSVMRQGQRSH